MSNIMVDLETLGKAAGSTILAIGAVRFDRYGIIQSFYVTIDVEDSGKHGFTIDPETVIWWLKQSDEARKAITEPRRKPLPVAEALIAFADFCGKDAKVWGNGANFDNKILEAAFYLMDQEQPWEFWNDRCYRTIKAAYRDVERVQPRIAHHALHDAEAQAETLIKIQQAHPAAGLL